MPPDVLLVLASSGISLVASLLFLVSDEREPSVGEGPPVSFCLPPPRPRARAQPPPLPAPAGCSVDVSTRSLHSVLTLKPEGDEWTMTLDMAPVRDAPAVRVEGDQGAGQVNDLRWSRSAGYVRATQRQWRVKPGRA
ncbi:MAG: hypothetical protein INH41_11155 [Myxococcaceae bacterium]|nr:hypothetical protein [Myxococcaceae bacterium]